MREYYPFFFFEIETKLKEKIQNKNFVGIRIRKIITVKTRYLATAVAKYNNN
jgi:hypothetical protein